jgi:hypothetical protein
MRERESCWTRSNSVTWSLGEGCPAAARPCRWSRGLELRRQISTRYSFMRVLFKRSVQSRTWRAGSMDVGVSMRLSMIGSAIDRIPASDCLPSPHYSRALLLHPPIRRCDKPGRGLAAPRRAGSTLVGSTYCFKYASVSRGSACPSRMAS